MNQPSRTLTLRRDPGAGSSQTGTILLLLGLAAGAYLYFTTSADRDRDADALAACANNVQALVSEAKEFADKGVVDAAVDKYVEEREQKMDSTVASGNDTIDAAITDASCSDLSRSVSEILSRAKEAAAK